MIIFIVQATIRTMSKQKNLFNQFKSILPTFTLAHVKTRVLKAQIENFHNYLYGQMAIIKVLYNMLYNVLATNFHIYNCKAYQRIRLQKAYLYTRKQENKLKLPDTLVLNRANFTSTLPKKRWP